MSLSDLLGQSAAACEGAALALAHALRPAATQAENRTPALLETFHEAEAFAITCRAVMEEIRPITPLLTPNGPVVGKRPPLVSTKVSNGFDSLAMVLVTLFNASNNAILDVAGNRARWLVSPLQSSITFERMTTHHGQLRAMYGIIHLAAKIVSRTDVEKTLFADVTGTSSHPELDPVKWRSAIKMDDFYGRCFGFHYAPEMRNVLRVVNIARGSVRKSHADDDPYPQLIKNVAMVGWGWIYSNMVLMNSLGITIDGVSQIGADDDKGMSVKELRKFMNLVEEPLVTGVSSIASSDVAMDSVFEIPVPGAAGGLEGTANSEHSEGVRTVLASISDSVRVRLMSKKARPVNVSLSERNTKHPNRPNGPESKSAINSNDSGETETRRIERKTSARQESLRAGNTRIPGTTPKGGWGSSGSPGKSTSVGDESFIASTIKTELVKLQSNLSSFLGLEKSTPAKCLILHFHGGGFISQSSTSHQVYLKEWCGDLPDSVLLSIDYKLAPEHRFPTALHECVYAYLWALQNKSKLGTLAERVIFAGDSAGGNLAISTAMLVHELGFRGPDGICVGYPALYLNVAWSPSRLLSFFDPMLPLSVLDLCVKAYIPEGDDGQGLKNPLLSPLVATDSQLRKLPRIAIVCGSLDPLLDDAVLFSHRLRQSGRDWDVLQIYESMPHGFLNMSLVNVTARKGMRFLASMIAEFAELPFHGTSQYDDEVGNIARAKAAAAAFDA